MEDEPLETGNLGSQGRRMKTEDRDNKKFKNGNIKLYRPDPFATPLLALPIAIDDAAFCWAANSFGSTWIFIALFCACFVLFFDDGKK